MPDQPQHQGGICGFLSASGLVVSGFTTGIKIGDDKLLQCASELSFRDTTITDCVTAVHTQGGGNTINIWFEVLNLRHCYSGVVVTGGPFVFVRGGTSLGVGGDRGSVWTRGAHLVVQRDGTFALRDFRAEGAVSGLLVRNDVVHAPTTLIVEGCESGGPSPNDWPYLQPVTDRPLVFARGNCSLTAKANTNWLGGILRWQSLADAQAGAVELGLNKYHPAAAEVVEMDPSAPPTEFVKTGTGRKLTLPNH